MRTHWPPLLALAVAIPLSSAAVVRSFRWFDAPFPGFFVMENAVVPTVSGMDWPPDKARVFHSQVVAIDGVRVDSGGEVYRTVASRPAGTVVAYRFRKGHRLFDSTVPTMAFTATDYLQTYGILILFGVSWLAFGVVVNFLQPRTRQARVYLWQAVVAGMYPVTAVFLHQPDFPVLTKLYFVLECFFPATWIHLALVFPVERRFVGWRRIGPVVPYLLSALLTASVLAGFYRDPPDLTALHAAYLYTAASIVFFIAALCFAYWEDLEPMARLRVKAVLPGLFLATGLPFAAFVDNAFAGRDFPVQFGLVFTPIGYASLAYAIAKRDLFDIDRVVRQSFVYGLLSIIVIGAYALVLIVPARLVPTFAAQNQPILGVVFVLALAFGLDPLRRAVQRLTDRAFYRTRSDYRATISWLSEAMTTLLDLHEVVAQVTRVVTSAMHLDSTQIVLLDGDTGGTAWTRTADGPLQQYAAQPGVAVLAAALEEFPQEFDAAALPRRIVDAPRRAQVEAVLVRAGAVVVLPLVFRNRPIGLLALGPKRSGRPFDADDIDLLRTLANQTAIALQNARSYQALQDLTRDLDQKVRDKTEALQASNEQLRQAYEELKHAEAQLVQSEKMASLGQLVAGVAHELNNPASFVHGALANLQDYLSAFIEVIEAYEKAPIVDPSALGAVAALRQRHQLDYLLRETPELLRICTEGSERVKKIVEDLRIFVRADQGDRVATAVTDGIESALRLLGDRIGRQGIIVTRDYHDVPPVEAHAGQLNQVWMNLLSNAIDAVEGRPQPAIRVTVRPCVPSVPPADGQVGGAAPGRWVEVAVADNGVGIAPANQAKIFEPFFTTKPIGRGTGLGLSIVYGAIRNHGGTVGVDSEPDRGTAVTVRLPVEAAAP